MRIETVIPPDKEPLSLQDAKDFCRIDADITDEDTLIEHFIVEARNNLEGLTRRSYAPQTLRVSLDGFPRERVIMLPRAPLIEVMSVEYDDVSGVPKVLDDYDVNAVSMPGVLSVRGAWPGVSRLPGCVRITYRAGHGAGDDEARVTQPAPEMALQAMRFMVLASYERRTVSQDQLHLFISSLRVWHQSLEVRR